MQEIKLSDYQRPFYWIRSIELDFDIFEDKTIVKSSLQIERNTEFNTREALVLDGIELNIQSLQINNSEITDYTYENDKLTLSPNEDQFVMTTIVEIKPHENDALEGLYQSGGIFCTQCEAEGFRRITFYQDRPDVMAKFTTKIRADKSKYPNLLSNGNLVENFDLDDGRHYTKWEDPFLKPAYLFALVAGDLAKVEDSFTTKSGKKVALEIFVDHGNEDKCEHAMRSLKNSMKWDEDVFGLEYDLDIYMIVAVDSFNMGAMENKGLNIFNSALVLAKKETATDNDFQAIEAVIGHEYFHNWTGNRVTCRDWFQLTLKEGLTVFRDQEFSSDMLSRPVKRIEDVAMLRARQFPEDAGPLSHPIKPKSYIEINNFYTSTIYEKGAEVIRMIHTLIGAENFRKGIDLYFERHDNSAVTTEDFVKAMSDASGMDLEHFKVWYDQNETPVLSIDSNYESDIKEFSFTISQTVKTNNSDFDCLFMPFSFALYDSDGKEIYKDKLTLSKKTETFTVKGIESKPIASWNTNFTAPVIVKDNSTKEDLIMRMSHDKDAFNQYDAAKQLYFDEILSHVQNLQEGGKLELNPSFVEAFGNLLKNRDLEDAFVAYAISLPSQMQLNQKLKIYDYENVKKAFSFVKEGLSTKYYNEFLSLFNKLNDDVFDLSAASMGKRTLKKVCLSYLAASKNDEVFNLLELESKNFTNMNDELSVLQNVVEYYQDKRESFVKSFFEKWNNDTLVMQKWLSVLSSASYNSIDDIAKLENSSVYNSKVPNLVRAVMRSFTQQNPSLFNKEDGSGYRYLADKILMIDKFNPAMASSLSKMMGHGNKLDDKRRGHLKDELARVFEAKLSKDTYEVISKNLKVF